VHASQQDYVVHLKDHSSQDDGVYPDIDTSVDELKVLHAKQTKFPRRPFRPYSQLSVDRETWNRVEMYVMVDCHWICQSQQRSADFLLARPKLS
jgi:hypothetical protein